MHQFKGFSLGRPSLPAHLWPSYIRFNLWRGSAATDTLRIFVTDSKVRDEIPRTNQDAAAQSLDALSTAFNNAQDQISLHPNSCRNDAKMYTFLLWKLVESVAEGSKESGQDLQGDVLLFIQDHLICDLLWPLGSLATALDALSRIPNVMIDYPRLVDTVSSSLTVQLKENQALSSLSPSALIQIVSALARLQIRPPGLLPALEVYISEPTSLQDLYQRPKAVGTLLRSALALDWPQPGPASETICFACITTIQSLSTPDIASLAWLIARKHPSPKPLLATMLPFVRQALPSCDMKELSDIARAYSKIRESTTPPDLANLFEDIAARATKCVDWAGTEDVARVISAFDKIDFQPEALLEVVETWADKRLSSLSPGALAAALASFAKMNNRSPRLLKTSAKCAKGRARDMSPRQIALVVWAFARLEYHPGKEMLKSAATMLLRSPTGFADREAANLLWALVRFDYHFSPDATIKLVDGLLPVVGTYSGHSGALMLWSFATIQAGQGNQSSSFPDRGNKTKIEVFATSIVDAVCRDIGFLEPLSISLTSWALGRLEIWHQPFIIAVEDLFMVQKPELWASCEGQHLSNLAWGLGRMERALDRYKNKWNNISAPILICRQFWELLGNKASERIDDLTPPEVFGIYWSYGSRRIPHLPLAEAAIPVLAKRGNELGATEISGMLWAYANIINQRTWDESVKSGLAKKMIEGVLGPTSFLLADKIRAMDEVQLGMTTCGLGTLLALATESQGDSLHQHRVQMWQSAIMDSLLSSLEQQAPTLNCSTLNTVLPALGELLGKPTSATNAQFSLSVTLKSALTNRILVLVEQGALAIEGRQPWYTSASLSRAAAQLGMNEAACAILDYISTAKDYNYLRNEAACVSILVAMGGCGCYPRSVLRQISSKLSRGASSQADKGTAANAGYVNDLISALQIMDPEMRKKVRLPRPLLSEVQAAVQQSSK